MIDLVFIFIVLLLLDVVWLKWLGGVLFRRWLGPLLRPKAHVGFALLVYVVMAIGLWLFVWGNPALPTLAGGFLFGFVMYLIYDLTNYATIKGWPLKMVAIDSLWGGAVSAITLCVVKFILG